MKFIFIVIDHINGEFEDLTIIVNENFAKYRLLEGYIVYKVNLENLSVEELK